MTGVTSYVAKTRSYMLSPSLSLWLILSLITIGVPSIFGGGGVLDKRFGSRGKITSSIGTTSGPATDAAYVAVTHHTLVVGSAADTSCCDFAAMLFSETGFFFGGVPFRLITHFAVPSAANAVAVSPPFLTRMVAGGHAGGDFALVAYTQSTGLGYRGNFGTDGRVVTDIGAANDEIFDLVVEADGRITAVGRSGDNFALARYLDNGSLDTSFGKDGIVLTPFAGSVATARSVLLQADGKIIASGTAVMTADGSSQIASARYSPDGALDTSFGIGGTLTAQIDSRDSEGNASALQRDGRLIVGASVAGDVFGEPTLFGLIRFNTDGTLDKTFNDTGMVVTELAGGSGARGVALQPNGKIVVSGESRPSGAPYGSFTTVRYFPDGSIDPLYGDQGVFVTDFGVASSAYSLTSATGGQIIVSGSADDPAKFAVARFLPEPYSSDFDGDGRTDISVIRPPEMNWYLLNSRSQDFLAMQFGVSTDKFAPADYDGDGKTDIAVYRPSERRWFVLNSATGTFSYDVYPLNGATDLIPVPADYAGDGKVSYAVYKNGIWTIQNSQESAFGWGTAGDIPVSGDFDGDRRADIVFYRPSTGVWWRRPNVAEPFGAPGDKPVPGDYDGDGTTDIAVFRPSEGIWYIKNSDTPTFTVVYFGLATDIPVPGDYDGDGKCDIAVFRPSDGYWYIANSSNSTFTIYQWGLNGDIPIPGIDN